MIRYYGINNNSKKIEFSENNVDFLKIQLYKSKGIYKWFNYIKYHKHKTSDISSILSNSLNIQITDTYFNKDSVLIFQERKKKIAKKILAV